MNRLMFLILLLSIYGAIDYYVFQAVKVVVEGSAPGHKKWIYTMYWSLTLITLLAVGLLNGIDSARHPIMRNFLVTGIAANFVSKLFAVIFVFMDDVIRLGQWAYQNIFSKGSSSIDPEGQQITRSAFLSKTALIAGAVPVAVFSFGILSGAYDYRVRRRQITLPNLPGSFDGIRLAQVSDIHSGSFYNKKAVRGGVELLLAEKPDLIFFTGDLVNNQSKEVVDYQDIFSGLKAPLGTFSVLGNHDYGDYVSWESAAAKRKNLDQLVETHRRMGWDILLNEHRYVEVDGDRLGIIGVENWGAGRFAKYGDLDKAATDVEAHVKILLSHDPSHWDAQVRPTQPDIDLTLSGHTHGFQFGVEIGDFKWSPSQYIYKQWADLYQEGNQYLYVNRGFGFLGYPGRVGILPEITILELKKA